MANERFFQGNYWDNLGINYDSGSGTFTIRGANGSNLSSSNPAVIVLPSKATPGNFTRYNVTANQDFIDANGSSQIINNLFGLTTGVAYASDVPFFIYAVTNDNEDTIQFMISRIPNALRSPSAANIGAPDDAVADGESDFFSLDNIDETLYDQNPCMCIGAFRATMSASDDWTVVTLDNRFDGIGKFMESATFSTVAGHFGAASGKFFKDNGGTAPGFNSFANQYQITRDGYCTFSFQPGSVDVAGVGAVNARLAIPFTAENTFVASGYYFDNTASTFFPNYLAAADSTTNVQFIQNDIRTGGFIQNQDFDTNDTVVGTVRFLIQQTS